MQVDYFGADALPAVLSQPDTLAVLGFGTDAAASTDPRYLHVPLQPHGAATLEVWRSQGPVTSGIDDGIRWSADGMLQFGAIEIDETHFDAHGNGIEAASAAAYARLHAFVRSHGYPHQLRIWNHLDAITAGDGDEERYRRFCLGRAAGLGHFDPTALPAASAIGRRDGVRTLQVYWLAARTPGTPIENPRQVSAYRYPRQYGPQSPSFARAMLPPSAQMPLLLSGTASVVGHESRHHDCVESQLAETFANFDSLITAARELRPALPAHFGPGSRLKVYVRDAEHLPRIAAALDALLGPAVPRLLLHAAICRRELQVEIDGVHS
nr:pteridine-dependent deoxygenase [Lysobacter sp. CFH 32150]